MTEPQISSPSTYEQTQQALFKQILEAVRIAVVMVLILTLGSLAAPAMRTAPVVLLVSLLLVEEGIVEISRWLVRQGRARESATLFVITTLIVAASVAAVQRFPGFAAVAAAVLVVIGALLIGPRYAVAPGGGGILLFALVSIADQQGWLIDIQLPQTSWLIMLIQIGFTAAALGVMIVVSALASDRLHQSARDSQERAEEAEQARAEQTELNEQLRSQVDEQRRLLALIQELETPAIPILSGVLVVPLAGHLDSRRLGEIERRLLQRVSAERTELVLIDITGVPIVDTAVAYGLIQLGQAVRLLGARTALTGLQPAMAQDLAQQGVKLGSTKTYATIRDALAALEFNR